MWFAADKVADAIPTVEGDLDLADTPWSRRPGHLPPRRAVTAGTACPDDFTNMGSFGGQRADVIMLVKVIPDGGQGADPQPARAISRSPTRAAGNGSTPPSTTDPPVCSRPSRTSLPNPIHHYLQVNFAGFAGIVDAVGGIEMTFPYPARDKKSGFSIPAGTHTLDGQQALQFARARKYQELPQRVSGSTSGPDDIGRTGRQQDVLMALLTQIDRPGSIGEFTDLVNALGGFVQSDDALNADDIIQLGWSDAERDAPPTSMRSPSRSTTPPQNGVAYVVQREPEATQALAAFRDGTSFEESVVGTAIVEVQNGNGVAGSAGAVAAVLEGGRIRRQPAPPTATATTTRPPSSWPVRRRSRTPKPSSRCSATARQPPEQHPMGSMWSLSSVAMPAADHHHNAASRRRRPRGRPCRPGHRGRFRPPRDPGPSG